MTRDMIHLSVCVHLLANGNGYYQATPTAFIICRRITQHINNYSV